MAGESQADGDVKAALLRSENEIEELKKQLSAANAQVKRLSTVAASGGLDPELEAAVKERLAGLHPGTMSREQALEICIRQRETDKQEAAKAEAEAKKAEAAKKAAAAAK